MRMYATLAIVFLSLAASANASSPALVSNTVPAIDSTGSSGSCSVSVDMAAKTGVVQSTVNKIQDMTAGHIHVAPAGQNGPVAVPIFSGDKSGTFSFTKQFQASDLSPDALGLKSSASPSDTFDAFVKQLNAHKLYCNYHTKVNPGGELRAQL